MEVSKSWLKDKLKVGFSGDGTGFRLIKDGYVVWNDSNKSYTKNELVDKIYSIQQSYDFDEIVLHGGDVKRIDLNEEDNN